ncbi:MAG: SOS response-associated peptidase family protein [Lautropia sp.]|nr:SOS response-associated peptidase family protein [Lautropia sp.]
MCNRYLSPNADTIARLWQVNARTPIPWWDEAEVFPRAPGLFIRGDADGQRTLAIGTWGLIPDFARTAQLRFQTNNARSEELSNKPSYRKPWLRGQRCLIPAVHFDEPCWETGRNVWWRFRRADGQPWALAGLWNVWTDPATGELVNSYTMLTINADAHPLMNRMHKPDPHFGPHDQDKRSVIPIEAADVDQWLFGSREEAAKLMRLAPVEIFKAAPAVLDGLGPVTGQGGRHSGDDRQLSLL